MVGPDEVVKVLAATPLPDAKALGKYSRRILADVWQDRLAKAPTRRQPKARPPRAYLKGGHGSVDKIPRGEYTEIPAGTGRGRGDRRPQNAQADV